MRAARDHDRDRRGHVSAHAVPHGPRPPERCVRDRGAADRRVRDGDHRACARDGLHVSLTHLDAESAAALDAPVPAYPACFRGRSACRGSEGRRARFRPGARASPRHAGRACRRPLGAVPGAALRAAASEPVLPRERTQFGASPHTPGNATNAASAPMPATPGAWPSTRRRPRSTYARGNRVAGPRRTTPGATCAPASETRTA